MSERHVSDVSSRRNFPAAKKFPLLVDRLEEMGKTTHRFGRTQHQDTSRPKRVVKERNQSLLDFRVQVDEEVSAKQEVELGERRVLDQVLHGEHDHFADFLLDAKVAILAHEKALEALRAHVVLNRLGEHTRTRELDRVVVEVGGENLGAPAQGRGLHLLAQRSWRVNTPPRPSSSPQSTFEAGSLPACSGALGEAQPRARRTLPGLERTT